MDAPQCFRNDGHQRSGFASGESRIAFWGNSIKRHGTDGGTRRLQSVLQHAVSASPNLQMERAAVDLSAIRSAQPMVGQNRPALAVIE